LVGLLLAGAPSAAGAAEPAGAAARTGESGNDGPGAEIEGPMRPDAQALYDRALSRFATRDYAAAIGDLEAGYALEPRRDFLFAEAQAQRLRGDCAGAVGLYQRFLRSGPPAVQASAAQIALGRCAQELANRPQVVVTVPAPPAPPAPPPKWWHDPWGLTLSGGAVVGLGVGVGYLAAALAARDDAGGAPTLGEYARRWSVAETRLDVAVGALAVGGALAAVGIARFVIVRRRAGTGPLAFWLGPGTLGLGGKF
jgi:tetratricopeptide (TPR) repeat protein